MKLKKLFPRHCDTQSLLGVLLMFLLTSHKYNYHILTQYTIYTTKIVVRNGIHSVSHVTRGIYNFTLQSISFYSFQLNINRELIYVAAGKVCISQPPYQLSLSANRVYELFCAYVCLTNI